MVLQMLQGIIRAFPTSSTVGPSKLNDVVALVHFLHPGGEHCLTRGRTSKPWHTNTFNHERIFIETQGKFVKGNSLMEGNIRFWAEWEPEATRISRIMTPVKDGPHAVFRPFYKRPHAFYKPLHTTDPFVFGDPFLYTFCKQSKRVGRGPDRGKRRSTQLRYLKRGSIILFGSGRDGRFRLDTVFVVGGHEDHDHKSFRALQHRVSDAFMDTTLLRVYRQPHTALGLLPVLPNSNLLTYRLYFGATFTSPVEGMFSYFPCRTSIDSQSGFALPVVELPEHIRQTQTQGYKVTPIPTLLRMRLLWDDVARQVVGHGLSMGTWAAPPIRVS